MSRHDLSTWATCFVLGLLAGLSVGRLRGQSLQGYAWEVTARGAAATARACNTELDRCMATLHSREATK
jgi:hypothetical protein